MENLRIRLCTFGSVMFSLWETQCLSRPMVLWHTRFTTFSQCIHVKLLSLCGVFLSFSYGKRKNSTLYFWLGDVSPKDNSTARHWTWTFEWRQKSRIQGVDWVSDRHWLAYFTYLHTKYSPCIYVKLLSLCRVFLSLSNEKLKNSLLYLWLGDVFPMEN